MNISNNAQKNIEILLENYGNSSEIVTRSLQKVNCKIEYIYLESVSSDDKISNFLMRSLNHINKKNIFNSILNLLKNNIENSHITTTKSIDDVIYYLSSGFTCLFIDKYNEAIIIETKSVLDRGINESSSETIVRGPKDSFTENHIKNIGLIRKRIKDQNLWFNEMKVGRRTKTKVSVAYIKDIANIKNVDTVTNKIKHIDIDSIIDSGYIRELIEGKELSAFPRVISTERPDLACMALLNGKIIILVENSPFVLILPAVLMDFIHSPEDYYQKPINISFSRILRVFCLVLSILIPALYVALMTFNHEIIPNKLLISLATQRDGVPFSTASETVLFIIIFEMLREADIHAPSIAGNAMSIVGALILGDAAVAAGIVSPIVIIVVAITSICELVFYDIDVINAVRLWKILFVFSAMMMGIIGITALSIIFITKLASLKCLSTPYLTPISPLNINALKDSIIRFSRKKLINRPSYLTQNTRRINDEKNNN